MVKDRNGFVETTTSAFNLDGGDASTDWKAGVEVWRLFTKEKKEENWASSVSELAR